MSVTNGLPDKELFERAADELNMPPSMLEKDWHVTQVLAFLSRLDHPGFEIVFAGGTALSKAHGLIQRFSEDIDFRVIARDAAPGRGALSAFKKAVVDALKQAGFPIGDDAVRARDGNRFFAIDIDYETHFERADGLRPHIQVEVTVHGPLLPVLRLPVQSFLTRLMKGPPEVESIACMSPMENAADKLSALVWRIPDRVRGDANDDPSLVRHIHDLATLETLAREDPQFPALALAAMRRDNNRPKNHATFATLAEKDKMALMLDILTGDAGYPKEYDLFVRGVSYAPEGSAPDFPTALEAVKRLADHVLRGQ